MVGAPLAQFPAEGCGVDTLHAPFLNERRTRGALWYSVAGNRGQAVLWLELDNGPRSAISRLLRPRERNKSPHRVPGSPTPGGLAS
jgi:hypothetical protein